jgi:hypothetical protein
MCFCETNPPFFGGISVVSGYEYISYSEKCRRNSVGSFWKTNPPGEVFWWGSVAVTTTSRHLVGLGLENEPTGRG